jgi:hypothetical protein
MIKGKFLLISVAAIRPYGTIAAGIHKVARSGGGEASLSSLQGCLNPRWEPAIASTKTRSSGVPVVTRD